MGVYGDRQHQGFQDGMGMVQGTEDMTQGPRHNSFELHTLNFQDDNALDVDVQRRHSRYLPQTRRNIKHLFLRVGFKGPGSLGIALGIARAKRSQQLTAAQGEAREFDMISPR